MRKGFVGTELLKVLSVFGVVVFGAFLISGCGNKEADDDKRHENTVLSHRS